MPIELLVDSALAKDAVSVGMMRLTKSNSQLIGRAKDYNALFITDSMGNPVAFYPLREIPALSSSPLLSFLHAELKLTFPHIDELVQNDRERLASGASTIAILTWVGERISERVQAAEEAQRASKNRNELQKAAVFNEELNQHVKFFLQEMQSNLLIDVVEDPKGGGPGSVGNGAGPIRTGEGEHDKTPQEAPEEKGGSSGEGGTLEVPGTAQTARRPKFPQVLLSEEDADPSKADGTTKHLTDRHPPLYQGDEDRPYNVWWLNTTHPFAEAALDHGGAEGSAFKNYHFFMFRDMVQREGLRLLQRRNSTSSNSEMELGAVEIELDKISSDFLAALPHDLTEKLLG